MKTWKVILVTTLLIGLLMACSEQGLDKEGSGSPTSSGDSISEKVSGEIEDESGVVREAVPEILSYWPTEAWQTTTPESVGMSSTLLRNMFLHIEEENIPMEGMLIIKDGYIVSEKYGGDFDEETPHPIYSVTKSITSALVGVAVQQGAIESVESKALSYLTSENITNLDQWKRNLTIQDFLTMKSGLDFPEQTEKGFYQSDTWKEFMEGTDPASFIMSRPLSEDPGRWNYSTGDARVVSKILQEATGTKLSEYAEQNLFSHLGISNVEWPTDRSGTSFGGTGVKMKPRDIAKIGYLYLEEGKWEEKQVLPEGWVQKSIQPYGNTNGNFDGGHYGYFFWLKSINGYETYRGMGLYGQYLVVVPELDLIVVQTSSGMDVDPLLEEYVIPSIES
ncbi:serine hydrolase domain-containing protein [Guptibacillus algicola]|uniref:serine hydrolase domain-containing protein n=1 Tax=Guptibacillus algicola TaxID=225844 RepID=UPI001CD20561|nr:serine hydrolase [Alkalihalobacillus algicola]MCA0985679.1 beta-lactamase family protein [Alkalihalobacillus algicola]